MPPLNPLFPNMDPEIKAKWVEALRSGKYKQGISYLRRRGNYYCCLGVLCDVVDPNGWKKLDKTGLNPTHDGMVHYPSDKIYRLSGLDKNAAIGLSHMNDAQQMTFDQIATWVENNL